MIRLRRSKNPAARKPLPDSGEAEGAASRIKYFACDSF